MVTQKQITLYTAKTELALEESGLLYTRFEIALQNKPEWYAPKVNPANKVPAIAYDGPIVSPDEPSPESVKLSKSLILLEFIADLSAPGKLLPTDPVLRAKVRFFIDNVANTISSSLGAVAWRGESPQKIFDAIEKIQSLLPGDGYAIGKEFTIADIAVAPFLARCEVLLEHDIGLFEKGTGEAAFTKLRTDSKFARYRKYLEDLQARESFKKTFDRENYRNSAMRKIAILRAPKQAEA